MQDAGNREQAGGGRGEEDVYGNSVYFLLNFSIDLNKNKVYKLFK